MNRLLCKAVVLALIAGQVSLAHAGLEADMEKMFSRFGIHANYTEPSIFRAQGRGYVVGGSFSLRHPPVPAPIPIAFDRPSFSAGCGGIDLHFGGFSFAGLDQYEAFFKQIPKALFAFAVKVGLDAISPTLRRAFDSVEGVINEINKYGMNSCQAAQMMVDGTAGRLSEANHRSCLRRLMYPGKWGEGGLDFVTAEKQCKKEGDTSGSNPDDEGLKTITGNVTWQALNKIAGLKKDDKELMQSIFGTVVLPELEKDVEKKRSKPIPIGPSIRTFGEFYKGEVDPAFPPSSDLPDVVGETAAMGLSYLKCDTEEHCLNPTPTHVKVETFVVRVEKRLRSVAEKLLAGDKKQDDADISFINGTRFPVYRMLTLATATGEKSISDSYIDNYKEVIAIELAMAYVQRLIQQTKSIINGQKTNLSEAEREFLTDIEKMGDDFMTSARDEENKLHARANQRLELAKSMEALDQRLHAEIPQSVRRLLSAGR